MTLSIIIVNYNTKDLLRDCLTSINDALKFDSLDDKSEVIVVDNNSNDDSCQMVRKEFKDVRLLRNKSNLGFAKGNNKGIDSARGEYLLLLNSDTKVTNGVFLHLLNTYVSDKKIAVVGAQLRNQDNSIQPSAGYFPDFWRVICWMSFLDDIFLLGTLIKPYHVENEAFYGTYHEVDWVTGACFLIPKEIVKQVGGLDEKIFMYGEEVEWCYRIKRDGYKVVFTADAFVFHLKGASSEGKEAGIVQEFKALKYFYRKYKPVWQQFLLPSIFKFGALLRLLLFGIITRKPKKAQLYAQLLKTAG